MAIVIRKESRHFRPPHAWKCRIFMSQLAEAWSYFFQLHQEMQTQLNITRMAQIEQEIGQTGTYHHTSEELLYGARVAWRNSTRCIGRLHWKALIVKDQRHLTTVEEAFDAILQHLYEAYNGGKIRSTITVLPQGFRIWNPQLISYAGYPQADGSVIGDPLMVPITQEALKLGWRKKSETPFDVLPLIIQVPGEEPELFKLPPEAVVEVPIRHPEYPWFEELQLKWHALPVISDMRLEIGGTSYTAAPFNGWYMGTEIGRDLGDMQRYNMLPTIAAKLGLNSRADRNLWKDRALLELNLAILHSFAADGITIVDHHTASRQFVKHESIEKQENRCLYADWGWVVPPMSASITPLFHTSYKNVIQRPNFFYQVPCWQQETTRPPHVSDFIDA